MNKLVLSIVGVAGIIGTGLYAKRLFGKSVDYTNFSAEDIPTIFPQTVASLDEMAAYAIQNAHQAVARILAIPDNKRTFENTIKALDRASRYDFSIPMNIMYVVKSTYDDAAMREASQKQLLEMANISLDLFDQNVDLYRACKAYYDGAAKSENLTTEERYLLDELMKSFSRSGLDKSEEIRSQIKTLNKELTALELEFDKHINEDNRFIEVSREELAGMDEKFIDQLEKTAQGNYKLTVDYPIYFPVMDHCTVATTRKKLWREFVNRAHPKNNQVLQTIILKRHQLANLLGYQSYAAYNIDNEMAQTPERVQDFLNDVVRRAHQKEQQEFELLRSDLPSSVTLSSNQKFYPWDRAHCLATFQKKHFNLDKREIAHYFPMAETLKGLLDIYRAFLGVEFKELPATGLWCTDVQLIQVSSKEDGSILGYLILDLYPRPNKYSHACEITVVPTLKKNDGQQPALAVVLANFPKPSNDRPSLLEHGDVQTFFHEFGHAIHEIIGSTNFASTAGTNVKRDFVELPSQMLEHWLWDKDILKQLSKHYQTGAPLPDELIDALIEQKNFASGHHVQRQIYLANLSLSLYNAGANADIQGLTKSLSESIRKNIEFDDEDNFCSAFGHLTGYGARYYGYMWSNVFALDMFYHIKERGLLNPEIGKRYIQCVIGKGGSADPNELLRDFLGREPNSDAFFKDLGL
ncbi:MAG TPA: M3 family metallopeptidase [Candidatus Babeliales bacterium]|nr:M3 family metallopeptidase [Candidatus Babeliales bacterium]